MGFGKDFFNSYTKRYTGANSWRGAGWGDPTGLVQTYNALSDIRDNANLSNMADQPEYADYAPSRGERGLAARMNPTLSNPQLAGWRAAAARPYGGTGTAAGAAAAGRAQNRGLTSIARGATGYWQRLMNMALEFQSNADQIRTTSPDAAALQGFLGGGGGAGLGMLAGSMGGK